MLRVPEIRRSKIFVFGKSQCLLTLPKITYNSTSIFMSKENIRFDFLFNTRRMVVLLNVYIDCHCNNLSTFLIINIIIIVVVVVIIGCHICLPPFPLPLQHYKCCVHNMAAQGPTEYTTEEDHSFCDRFWYWIGGSTEANMPCSVKFAIIFAAGCEI